MKIILVPTDFSPEAEAGLEYAVALAGREDYRLILLHAFHLDTADILYSQIVSTVQSFKDVALEQLQLTRDLISSKVKIQPECIFEEGALGDVVNKIIKKRKIDFIIMGTHGAKGLKKLFFGSNTSGIIHNARCPVISVPQDLRFKNFSKIVFATNYHREDIEELRLVVDLVKPNNAYINVIHATRTPDNRLSPIMQAFEGNVRKHIHYPYFSFQMLKGNQTQETLSKYLETEKPDLFAISTRKRQFIERLAGPGISETFSLECHFPLLIFHQATPPLVF
ncbi:universal stress protein [Aurantibacillus circumpalustris]|uniref:universal stress protein n=1 Tax=Aurantibacillus circumpalustris TaxID=3036359 RepID=UPI00295A5F15|nr:universal stress protein [Aurantibacillus circumpalustris]